MTLQPLGNPQPVEGRQHLYVVLGDVIKGGQYGLACPECHSPGVVEAEATGISKWVCPQCGCGVAFRVVEPPAKSGQAANHGQTSVAEKPSEPPQAAEPPKETQAFRQGDTHNVGEMVWGGLLGRRRVRLREGTLTIGRKDADLPSDIALDDHYASRRSATLEVTDTPDGYLFKFTVVKATNPVCVNERRLALGESIYLAYNDNITMGKTHITFKKTKQK